MAMVSDLKRCVRGRGRPISTSMFATSLLRGSKKKNSFLRQLLERSESQIPKHISRNETYETPSTSTS